MNTLLLVTAALIVSSVAFPLEDDDKIINGYECPAHSQPWQAFLTTDNKRWCGAVLINEWWLVSAAHCYKPASSLIVHLGEHNLVQVEGTEQRIKVSKVFNHPGYSSWTIDNDIMLIKLQSPVQFNEYIQPIQLANNCAPAGSQCLVSGWGNLRTSGVQYPESLQCLDVPILSDTTCRKAYGNRVTDNMFCAGFMEGGKDSCQGDSGGPLVCDGVLQGIVSWGDGCAAKNAPGVYAKVCNYNTWVAEIIAKN
ncbi:trypsin-like [Polypterus senegalus]|uniref:trypsin-like n=1 Tax=Polypterus senegalus TaxID=55291 RepID=UPI0019657586|nr:trypsin-like [Polypterus senegalus]